MTAASNPIGRAVSRRMLAFAALGFLIGLSSTIAAKRWLEYTTVRRDAAELLARGDELRRCAARPSEFVGRTASGSWLFAYDGAGRASHPDAPPLRLALEPSTAPGAYVARRSSPFLSIAELGFRIAPSGPCAWLVAHRRSPRFDPRSLLESAALALVAMVVTLLGVGLGVVRPLLRRIGEVRALAARVGTGAVRFPPPRATGDELDAIVDALRATHDALAADRGALTRSNAALEEHLATTAHDLRTPVAALQLAVERATSLVQGRDAAEALRGAMLDAYYVGGLVENLHLTTRLRGASAASPVIAMDLTELVRAVSTRAAIVARHAGVSLACATPEGPLPLAADPLAVERAISNLTDNAIRHARRNVALVLERKGAGGFELTVADDGAGFDESGCAHASALGIAVAGRGQGPPDARARSRLGLSVTARIARSLDAEVAIATSASGSVVTIAGRRAPAPAAETPTLRAGAAPGELLAGHPGGDEDRIVHGRQRRGVG
jgi:signal transduction histidine kinase